jgi:hypothetical protein
MEEVPRHPPGRLCQQLAKESELVSPVHQSKGNHHIQADYCQLVYQFLPDVNKSSFLSWMQDFDA